MRPPAVITPAARCGCRVVDAGRDTAYWTAQLRYLGCTAHAHEVAVMFGDIQTQARTVVYDASNPAEVLRDAMAHELPAWHGIARMAAVASILASQES